MDLARPYRVLSHPLDGAVLTVLSGTSRPLTGREVARLAPEGSQPGIWKALGRLSTAGLVHREEAGNALLYTLNWDHLMASAVATLAGLRQSLFNLATELVAGWAIAPAHASIFGSAARGDGDADSDIDILIVRPVRISEDDERWRSQLRAFATALEQASGNAVSISEIAQQDLPRLTRERPPIVEAVVSDAVTLAGTEAAQLFRRGQA